MQEVIITGFVSPLHRERVEGKAMFNYVVSDTEDYSKAPIKGNPILIAVILSGGTSALIKGFVEYWGLDRILLVSYPSNNSLASLLDAKSALLDLGLRRIGMVHLDELNNLSIALKIAQASARVLKSKVAVVGLNVKTTIIKNFENAFQSSVDLIPMEEFEGMVDRADDNAAKAFVDELIHKVSLEVPGHDLMRVGKIYVALRNLYGNYDATAINCFPFLMKNKVTPCLALARLNEERLISACEVDLRALTSMLISRELTGYSGWIANVNHVTDNSILMSHCTIALNMVYEPKVTTHFESGYNYGLTGRIRFNEVTAVSISSDFTRMVAFKAFVSSSGLLRNDVCRTQGILNVDFNSLELIRKAPYNHHVIMPGNQINNLSAVAGLLGMDFEALH